MRLRMRNRLLLGARFFRVDVLYDDVLRHADHALPVRVMTGLTPVPVIRGMTGERLTAFLASVQLLTCEI